MKTKCHVIAVALLFIAATGSAQTTYENDFVLGETSSGEVYPDGSTRVGFTLEGTARGDLDGHFALTLSHQPGSSGPGVTNTIIGSNWILDLDNGQSIWGTVDGGSITWSSSGHTATFTAALTIAGGAASSGVGHVRGTLLRGRHLSRLRGTLSLTF